MIVMALLDTSTDLDQAESELGQPVEQLLTPLTRFSLQRPTQRFAIDNGAFAGFNAQRFTALLEREKSRRELCRFVSVPDVVVMGPNGPVGDARRTLEVFDHWAPKLTGWPLAFVCQDGQEALPIPWARINAVFIGGSTAWKLSQHAAACIKAAKSMGVWAHVGRINTPGRWEYFEKLGADSCDGSGLARYGHMREDIADSKAQVKLF